MNTNTTHKELESVQLESPQKNHARKSGILCAISSLPSNYGIGCFDEAAYRFVDWLVSSKQSLWQILPLGHSGRSASPYKCYSAFAGHPFYIDLTPFINEGILTQEECSACEGADRAHVDYDLLREKRLALLRKVFLGTDQCNTEAFKAFLKRNAWVESYAQFMAIKESLGGIKLRDWPSELRIYGSDAVAHYLERLTDKVRFYEFLQFVFMQQWHALKDYANARGIRIVGDIPIYVSDDSADLWANPELFQTQPDGQLMSVAGCPPDAFSATGQVWGNPLYDWPAHQQERYAWWIQRMQASFELFDIVRIDHFRGFESYFVIDAITRDAATGHWEKGPGYELFSALRNALGERAIIVEDLGTMTEAVKELVAQTGFPNMRILEFGFDSRSAEDQDFYLPHAYPTNCVAYTGTHDNETLQQWLESIKPKEYEAVRAYLTDTTTPRADLNDALIALVMRSAADVSIIPLQDWLGLGAQARMNKPATVGGNNWAWRVQNNELSSNVADKIAGMTKRFARDL